MTTEPTPQEMFNGAAALSPFARRWPLPLNPEDLDELVYAVLRHARSTAGPEEIVAAVDAQIDEFEARNKAMYEAMERSTARKRETEA